MVHIRSRLRTTALTCLSALLLWPALAFALSTRRRLPLVVTLGLLLALSTVGVFAQESPWERSAMQLELSFTGVLARSLATIALVVAGLMLLFGEHGAKGRVFMAFAGVGLALFAPSFLTWIAG